VEEVYLSLVIILYYLLTKEDIPRIIMNEKDIKIGNFKTKDIVDIFGSESQKALYLKNKKIAKSTQTAILNKAKLYCDIKYLEKGEYVIEKVYNEKKNPNIDKILDSEIYSVLAPIIIDNLIKSKIDNEYMLNLSLINYYNLIKLVHKDNYNNIRYLPKQSSELLDLEIRSIDCYFKASTRKLRYYLESCLELLKKAYVIKYFKIPFVKVREISIENTYDKVITKVKNEHRRATKEEVRYIEDVITNICFSYNIKRENFIKVFYDPRLSKIKEEYNEKLIAKNIILYYDGYEVYYTDIKKSEEFMFNFDNFNLNECMDKFIIFMSNSIKESINSRYSNHNKEDIDFINNHVLDYTEKTLNIHNKITSNTKGSYHNYENLISETE
jgi:hypothetical protein